jgi:hypothetical protein
LFYPKRFLKEQIINKYKFYYTYNAMPMIVEVTDIVIQEPQLFSILECILNEKSHTEQLGGQPACNKVLNCAVQTSAKGISSMQMHTVVVLP